MRRIRECLPLLAAMIVFVTVGCGGRGGGGTAAGTGGGSGSAVAYLPNYVSSLTALNHWSQLPAKVYFALPSNWSSFYPPDVPTIAAQSWNQPGEQAFVQVVASQSQANFVCSFVNYPPADWSTDQVGITNFAYDPTLHLLSPGTVSVTCAMHYRNGQLVTAEVLQGIIAHELGHALGINGHSPNTDDLLYPVGQPGIRTPQVRDLNTARTAYPAYFGIRSLAAEPAPTLVDPSNLIHGTIE